LTKSATTLEKETSIKLWLKFATERSGRKREREAKKVKVDTNTTSSNKLSQKTMQMEEKSLVQT